MKKRNTLLLAISIILGILAAKLLGFPSPVRYGIILFVSTIVFLITLSNYARRGPSYTNAYFAKKIKNGLWMSVIAAVAVAVFNIGLGVIEPSWQLADFSVGQKTVERASIVGSGALFFEIFVMSAIGLFISLQFNKENIPETRNG